MIERSLILLKPDTVARGFVGEIISRFEKVGLKIVGIKMAKPDQDFYFHHYETIGTVVSRRGQKVFDAQLDTMNMGPVIAMALEGVEAVSLVRKMVWVTNSKEALPGTIRGDYSHMSFAYAEHIDEGLPNVIHASGNSDEAKLEVAHWFKEDELFDYQKTDHQFIYGKKKN